MYGGVEIRREGNLAVFSCGEQLTSVSRFFFGFTGTSLPVGNVVWAIVCGGERPFVKAGTEVGRIEQHLCRYIFPDSAIQKCFVARLGKFFLAKLDSDYSWSVVVTIVQQNTRCVQPVCVKGRPAKAGAARRFARITYVYRNPSMN